MKSEPCKFIPLFVEGQDFPCHIFSEDGITIKMLTEMADKTGRNLSEMLHECFVRLFKNELEYDIGSSWEEWEKSIGEDEARKRMNLLAEKMKSFRK